MTLRAFVLVLSLVLSSFAQKLERPPADSIQSIDPTELRANLEFLTSPELGGRYTLSPSFPIAAKYLATRLEAYGYKGAANGSFFQVFDVTSAQVEPDKSSLSLTIKNEKTDYKYGAFYNNGYVGGEVDAPVVFVGHGVSSKSQKYDDYANIDVKGKIVMLVGGTPTGVEASKLESNEKSAEAAAAHGAVAVFHIPSKAYVDQMRKSTYRDRASERAFLSLDQDKKVPEVRLAPETAEVLLSLMGLDLKSVHDAETHHKALPAKELDARAHLVLSVKQQKRTTQNVVGVLEGTDPNLKHEYVTFSAHYDHLKTGADGRIYPGADDDGSGTVSVLGIAKAMALHLPKRSTLIIFHAGEELGLLGSEFNADYSPVVPISQMVTDLNIDMVGRNRDNNPKNAEIVDQNSIYVIGADKLSKELNDIHERTNKDTEKLSLDYRLNDPNEPNRFYFRSDHWNYAKHGVPIIFWFDGTGEDYHQPTDTIDKIDFQKMARVARLAYATGFRIANLDHRLVVDGGAKNAD